ncbi:protein BONZAI 3-like isoform X1 [Zingiber officinale]|uniref:protein BONZAI 3-like isoform X1 n=2 Tax=Zingiber officinale TaxID=94328 RepID=UPI001C4D17DE|nr:protein BONZAI 3-like isoform X1 [Zingiber officinale]
MGGCCSDVKGGQQAVGTGGSSALAAHATAQQEANDAVGYLVHSRGLRGLYTTLELSLSASKLRDLDVLSKSDPLAILHLKRTDGILEELGRTEVIMNNLSPTWITKFTINYQFEIVQHLVIRVYDVDTKYHNMPVKTINLNEQDYLGEASCVLSEIVTKPSSSLTLTLQQKRGPSSVRSGTITVHAEEPVSSRNAFEITFRCSKLENKDVFSKSDPFLRISKVVESGIIIPVCKTEVVNNDLNPIWKPVTLRMQQLGSKENPLIIECFDFNVSGKHEQLGTLQTSVADIEKLAWERGSANFYAHSHHGAKKMLKGQLFVDNFIEKSQFSFLDYISSGFQLNFMVAIDFTASNGDPRHTSSLHFIDPSGRLNSYQQAIISVGEVLQFYDSDKHFPAWGFGGRISHGSVSHCFNLNGSPGESEVSGVEGIMAAYAMALHNVALSGPTLFGPVICKAAEIATQSLSIGQNKYYALLIITDGVITDLQATVDAIVRASDLPMSILIVGVGGADFKEMEFLDADNGKRLESSTGRIATRDIVQFVPMRDLQGNQVSVAQSLLEELPVQFLSYMWSRDIKPFSLRS